MITKKAKPAQPFLQEPPGGMWYETRPAKTLPYLARWRGSLGLKAKSFASESERAEWAAAWLKQRQKFGEAAQLVDARTVATWTEFRELVGDVHPLVVAREWLDWRGTAGSLTVETAWADFSADQEKRKLSDDTHSHRRLHGKRILAAFGGRLVASLQSEDLDKWIANLRDPDTGEAMSAKTKRHHLKTLRHWLEWLRLRRKLAHNPADALSLPDASDVGEDGEPVHREINILTVEQAEALFAANAGGLAVGRLALEAFGGLRYTSAARLRRDDILWDDEGIVMPGHLHKSGQRHYVDGWPDNLWAWMRHASPACWDVSRRQYAELKREAFEAAGLKPKQQEGQEEWTAEEAAAMEQMRNVLRHSFATYHLAAHKDAKLTAYLMTKTSVQNLMSAYRGRATKAAGDAYFAIMPK